MFSIKPFYIFISNFFSYKIILCNVWYLVVYKCSIETKCCFCITATNVYLTDECCLLVRALSNFLKEMCSKLLHLNNTPPAFMSLTMLRFAAGGSFCDGFLQSLFVSAWTHYDAGALCWLSLELCHWLIQLDVRHTTGCKSSILVSSLTKILQM